MTFKYGKSSRSKLDTAHPDLIMIYEIAIESVDITILEGHRSEELQNLYFSQRKSKLKYPQGKHNKKPSLAVDSSTYPIVWSDPKRFSHLAFFLKGIALAKGIKLTIGCDWNGDFINNESFFDGPHVELHSKLIDGVWVKY